MNNVLIVDDETDFLLSLQEGLNLRAHNYNILIAHDGIDALNIVESTPIDLIITDLHMPNMDGFQLISRLFEKSPHMPIVVMTAFNTPKIEKTIQKFDTLTLIEKPLDIHQIEEVITTAFAETSEGHLTGITLPSFLQLLELEKKTCSLIVHHHSEQGTISLTNGTPTNATCKDLEGTEALYAILRWETVELDISRNKITSEVAITLPLQHLLMDAMTQKDQELERKPAKTETPFYEDIDSILPITKETLMSAQEKLKVLAEIDGFEGAGIFTPTGEALAVIKSPTSDHKLQSVGVLANHVLLNAQKATKEMGVGRGQLIHIMADDAQILVRCLNEGTDPLKSQPGKAHIHIVLVLKDEMSIGLAKMRLESVSEDLAEDFR